jgi:ADP-ribose pyrophosphatase YjhB (NUDIX family)
MTSKKDPSYCIDCGAELDAYGRAYPPKQKDGYLINFLESAAVFIEGTSTLLYKNEGKLCIPSVLVKNLEDPVDASIRAIKEKFGLLADTPKLLKVLGDPKRNPKGCYICCIYTVKIKEGKEKLTMYSKDYINGHIDELAVEYKDFILSAINGK